MNWKKVLRSRRPYFTDSLAFYIFVVLMSFVVSLSPPHASAPKENLKQSVTFGPPAKKEIYLLTSYRERATLPCLYKAMVYLACSIIWLNLK